MCQSDSASFIRMFSVVAGLLSLLPIILPNAVSSFYMWMYEKRGYSVNPSGFFWSPLMMRIYGLGGIVFAMILYLKAGEIRG